jgi:hypothetical protein
MPSDPAKVGGHKGMAFCTYADTVYSSAAIRRLRGHMLSGRALRIEYADVQQREKQLAGVLRAGEPPRAYTAIDLQWLAESLDATTLNNIVADARQAAEQHPEEFQRLLDGRPEVVQALAHVLYAADEAPWSEGKASEQAHVHVSMQSSPSSLSSSSSSSLPCNVCRRPAARPIAPPCHHVCCTDCLFGLGRAACPTCHAPFDWNRMFPAAPRPLPVGLTLLEQKSIARLVALSTAEVEALPVEVRAQVRQLRAQATGMRR